MTDLTAKQEAAFMRYFPTANILVADSHRARRIFQAGWQAASPTPERAMQANNKRPNNLHASPHERTLACGAPPKCKMVESEATIAERFLETERENHKVSIAEWERCEAERESLQTKLAAIPARLEQAARQIAEIWGVKDSKDFDEECILGILRETIKGKP